jgi:FtsX-like permease family protein
MKILNQILWEGKNKWQIYGAALGAFLGLFLVLTAFQFYHDLQNLISGDNTADQYVIINKKVNLFNTLGANAAFTPEEIDTLEDQGFILSVGQFNSNQYKVGASSPAFGFYTELFFESVPDEFIDINTGRFSWSEGQEEIPIIMSRDYLALYNFGFAPSQGLPQFTPNTIGRISVDIIIRGNGLKRTYQGRIIGFSDRINSIIVPDDFLAWSNKKFGTQAKSDPSRVILKTDNPYSTELQEFMKAKNYEASSGKLIGGKLTALLQGIISAIAIIGFIIVLLSVLVFVLNFQLIISQSKEDIRLLLQMGYKNKQVSDVLTKRLFRLFLSIILAVLVTMALSRMWFTSWFEGQGLDIQSGIHWTVYVLGILLGTLIIFMNYRNISKNVNHLF